MQDSVDGGYIYDSGELNHSHDYLLPSVNKMISDCVVPGSALFDLGCGNGSVANHMSTKGYAVTGVDISDSGIAHAKSVFPHLSLHQASVYDRLADRFGQFPLVYSLEVVEHLYAPRDYVRTLHDLIAPGGHAVLSTPYHGYWKNLVMAATGKMDAHFTALWDNGHIKFWSVETLTQLLGEVGLKVEKIDRVGRIPALAKSMVLLVRKP